MDRRGFIKSAALSVLAADLAAQAEGAVPADEKGAASARDPEVFPGDALNPGGVRLAGTRVIPVVGGKYKVWTKRIGRGSVKVLLLHGGPGFNHVPFEAMEAFLPEAGIEMYYYDQLGCGYSDRPDDTSLWTIERYVEEVEDVRRGLGLDKFVLYGHSWGGMLAIDYALKYQSHLRGLVISNMTAGVKSYVARTAALRKRLLPPEKFARMAELEGQGLYDSEEYQDILVNGLYRKMICRLDPLPEQIWRAVGAMNETIYNQMQGKTEFEVTGNLKGWERWDRLREIGVKTLTIGSYYDEMDPEDMKRIAALVRNGTYAYCPNGSHMCFWDDQATYFRHLISFLQTV